MTQMQLSPVEGGDYDVKIIFRLSAERIFTSKWANLPRVALEAADEALNELKCATYEAELNEGKPYEKSKETAQQDEIIAVARAKDKEKKP